MRCLLQKPLCFPIFFSNSRSLFDFTSSSGKTQAADNSSPPTWLLESAVVYMTCRPWTCSYLMPIAPEHGPVYCPPPLDTLLFTARHPWTCSCLLPTPGHDPVYCPPPVASHLFHHFLLPDLLLEIDAKCYFIPLQEETFFFFKFFLIRIK